MIRAAAVVVASAVTVAGLAWATLFRHAASPRVDVASKQAAAAFLDRYVDAAGRVVRRDQGGDTVSEGQAYAMLLAAATDDRSRFDAVWQWTTAHLRRSDGLLSWHWSNGAVVDTQAASDADLDAAWALAIAGERFHSSAYRHEAAALGRAILDHETVTVGNERILAAGPWALANPVIVNPSYPAPAGMASLAAFDRRWSDVAASSRKVIDDVTDDGHRLPPEWAAVDPDGSAHPVGTPDDRRATPTYSFQAVRTLSWWRASCERGDQVVASRAAPLLSSGDPAASARSTDGSVIDASPSAVAAVAAGQLDRAAAIDAAHPTYYGSAWVALGRVLFTSSVLCPTRGAS